jgi:predicted GNAT family N-acyltransferase
MELLLIDPVAEPLYASEVDLRYRVLREPLGMRRDQVGFEGEATALHVVATEDSRVIGCVLFDFRSGRLRAMAVEPTLQRSGVGRLLVRRLEEEVSRRRIEEIRLHARADVVGFYEKLGYAVRGEPFVEVGIPHREMHRRL